MRINLLLSINLSELATKFCFTGTPKALDYKSFLRIISFGQELIVEKLPEFVQQSFTACENTADRFWWPKVLIDWLRSYGSGNRYRFMKLHMFGSH